MERETGFENLRVILTTSIFMTHIKLLACFLAGSQSSSVQLILLKSYLLGVNVGAVAHLSIQVFTGFPVRTKVHLWEEHISIYNTAILFNVLPSG